jgi:signal peptidase II
MFNISIILFIIITDQLTKWWIVDNFTLYETQDVISGFFNLTYITNTGAAFGFLSGDYAAWRQIFFVTVSVVALSFMVYIYKQLKEQGRIFVIAICMIAGGAVGNLIDRLRFGSVIDFLDFHLKGHHWPAFNVADSAITVGVGLFLIGHFCCSCKCEQKK